MRDQYVDTIWDIYHQQLSRTITRLGSDAERLYSRATFDQERRRVGRFGALMAPMLLQVITAPAAELPDMDQMAEEMEANGGQARDAEMFLKGKSEEAYNQRVTDVMRDADAYGFFNF